jgi:hypothetical protein
MIMTLVASVDSERAVATRKEDKDMIFSRIRGSIGFTELNVRVRGTHPLFAFHHTSTHNTNTFCL